MARAKRTDRAEARRRFRQNQLESAAVPNELAGDDTAAVAVAASPAPVRRSPAPPAGRAAQPSGRPAQPGVMSAFRVAAAPADIRGDLRALPSLLRTRAAIVPGALILASVIVAFAAGASGGLIPAIMFQAFLAPPPMAASFLAGILTNRAAWLLGLVAGLAAGVAFAVVILVAPDAVILGLFRATTAIPAGFREQYALQALAISPLMGLATGAFAGFYRRFLRLASPTPSRSGNRSGKPRKAAARR